MDKLKNPPFPLIVFFLLIRILNLTLLPIFNDESIYLDWGLRELHEPGLLFYSLYDAKQPLLMWVFGIFQLLPYDPLFTGRIVSVFFGLLTAVGLYKIGKELFGRDVGLIAFFLYSIIPIFSFYDRQALMEASVGAVGAWSFYFLHKAFIFQQRKHFFLLGTVLGLGFFIKSSSLIFLASTLVVLTVFYFKNQPKDYFKNILCMFAAFLVITLLLLIHPEFWKTLHMNDRFSWSLEELFKFPISFWVSNLLKNIEIVVLYFTPVAFLGIVFGVYKILGKKKSEYKLLLSFLFFTLFLETILVKGTSQRYLVPFLPLLVLPASYAVGILSSRFNRLFVLLIFSVFPLFVTLIQLSNPVLYFNIINNFSNSSQMSEYISSQPSGYATLAAAKYLEGLSKNKRIGIGVGVNTGNPESAMIVYFDKNPKVRVFYLDSMIISGNLSKLDCFDSNIPIYFVSRENQLVGLDKFLVEEKSFKNPYGENTVGVYRLKECSGVKFKINI